MVLSNGCNRRSLYFFMTKWLHTKLIMTETTPKTVEVCQRHSCRFLLPHAVYVYVTVHGVHSRHYCVLGFERIRWCQGHPLSGIHCHSTQRINITIYMYAYYFFLSFLLSILHLRTKTITKKYSSCPYFSKWQSMVYLIPKKFQQVQGHPRLLHTLHWR